MTFETLDTTAVSDAIGRHPWAVVVGGSVLLLFIAFVIYKWCSRRRDRNRHTRLDDERRREHQQKRRRRRQQRQNSSTAIDGSDRRPLNRGADSLSSIEMGAKNYDDDDYDDDYDDDNLYEVDSEASGSDIEAGHRTHADPAASRLHHTASGGVPLNMDELDDDAYFDNLPRLKKQHGTAAGSRKSGTPATAVPSAAGADVTSRLRDAHSLGLTNRSHRSLNRGDFKNVGVDSPEDGSNSSVPGGNPDPENHSRRELTLLAREKVKLIDALEKEQSQLFHSEQQVFSIGARVFELKRQLEMYDRAMLDTQCRISSEFPPSASSSASSSAAASGSATGGNGFTAAAAPPGILGSTGSHHPDSNPISPSKKLNPQQGFGSDTIGGGGPSGMASLSVLTANLGPGGSSVTPIRTTPNNLLPYGGGGQNPAVSTLGWKTNDWFPSTTTLFPSAASNPVAPSPMVGDGAPTSTRTRAFGTAEDSGVFFPRLSVDDRTLQDPDLA